MKNRSCDILIVGGGIAGIAIAERLAREAHRQGKLIDIVLIERNPQLAMRASSGLEGWFHTGSLYAKIRDGHSFLTCLKSLEDMTNWYANDSLFLHHQACTIEHDSGSGIRVVPDTEIGHTDSSAGWFESPIRFEIQPENGSQDWDQTSQMIQSRLNRVFHAQSWAGDSSWACRMPDICLDTTLDESIKCEQAFTSADVTMNTTLILQHLTESAARFGVEFLVNHSALLMTEPDASEKKIVAVDSVLNERIEFRATQVIYALGDQSYSSTVSGLAFHRIESVMITRQPEISTESSVVLCADSDDNINHVYHPGPDHGYSILADSNSIQLDEGQAESSLEDKERVARDVYRKAKEQFGACVGEYSDWNIVSCVKTEVQAEDESPRVYSYWWGPEYASWTHPDWVSRRMLSQYQTQETIRTSIPQLNSQVLDSLKEDSWALKKSLHFGLVDWMIQNDGSSSKRFQEMQVWAFDAATSRRARSGMPPILVIPGKFSLFPSVAHNIYLESEMRGLYLGLKDGQAEARVLPKHLIAQLQAMRANLSKSSMGT